MEHTVTNTKVCFVDNGNTYHIPTIPMKISEFLNKPHLLRLNSNNNMRDSKSTPKQHSSRSSSSSSSSSKQLHSHIIPSPHYDDNNNPSTFVYSDNKHYQGKLMLLDYMIYFFPNEEGFKKLKYNKDYFMIPIYAISSLSEKNDGTKITITTKDRRHITFLTATSEFYTTLSNHISLLHSSPSSYHSYALTYHAQQPEHSINGWHIYNINTECLRMELPSYYRITTLNVDFTLCSSYPQHLIIPSQMQDSYLKQLSEYRMKHRFPVLTYYYKHSQSSLLRSSQCLSTGKARALSLENDYFNLICAHESKTFKIYDARSFLHAKANTFKGGYLEQLTDYDKCSDVVYCDIDNIHAVTKSYKAMFNIINDLSTDNNNAKHFYSSIESSLWLTHISSIIKASYLASNTLKHGRNVLVHCSDGWDRTSQICSLVQLMIDSYYRTINGFCVLVEKEWVCFGHNFIRRNGKCGDDKDFSPVFIQFLDCVYQLMQQFPTAFEFNTQMLLFIAGEVYSGKYGTFGFNCEKEIEFYKGKQRMMSLWSEVITQSVNWYNTAYIVKKTPLKPECEVFDMKIWKEFFFKYYTNKEQENDIADSAYKHYYIMEDMLKVIKDNNLYGVLSLETQGYLNEIFKFK